MTLRPIDKNKWPLQSAIMHLITMAHVGEAQGVIETFKLKKNNSNHFIGEDLLLIITGEGPFEAATQTALALGQYQVQSVINLGIAGALSSDLKLGEIYPIRTHYLIQDFVPAFKTFTPSTDGIDCVTSFERILDPNKAQKLSGLGQLVDREAWGVAYAAKAGAVTFKSYKLISDIAGTLGACEVIKEEAVSLSQKLSDFLIGLMGKRTEHTSEDLSLKGFHFTFTTSHQYQNLLNKLSIKFEKTKDQLVRTLPIDELLERDILPKERARLLIEHMEFELDPVKRVLTNEKSKWLQDFTRSGIEIHTDPQWENSKVTVRFDVENNSELSEKLEILNKLSLDPFLRIMNGDIHVE